MAFNYVLTLLLLAGGGAGIAWNFRKTLKEETFEGEYQNIYTISYLVEQTKEYFNNMIKENLTDSFMNRDAYDRKLKDKLETRKKLKEAAFGNKDAKEYIKSRIVYLIQVNFGYTDEDLHKFIPFNRIDELTSVDMTEILIYAFSKYCSEKTNGELRAKDGLPYMIEKYHLNVAHEDYTGLEEEDVYDISAKQIREIYIKESEEGGVLRDLTFDDRLAIIAQRVFEQYKGFGCIDLLVDQAIDEIDCGVSGIPQGLFEVDKSLMDNITYSFESVWIMYHGLNIRMSCLKFENEAEFIRVCQNIYRYDAPTVLSRKEGKVASTMQDGSRVLVTRPPFSDSWTFFVRKHNAGVVGKQKKQYFTAAGGEHVETMMKWLIRGQRNIIYSGSQGTGKTTAMKHFFKYVPITFNVRIQEMIFELNLRYLYQARNNVAFQETADVSAQEGLNTQKKTNGTINIIGEIATAEAASWYVQTSKVASLYAWGSHHAKTAFDLVTSFRDNLLQTGIFSNEIEAEATAATALNIDFHMDKNEETESRFLERITEIVPIRDHSYPTDHMGDDISLEEKALRHTMEYETRITDRSQFTCTNLIEYHDGEYYVTNMPSAETLAEMRNKVLPTQREAFDADMETLRAVCEVDKKRLQEKLTA